MEYGIAGNSITEDSLDEIYEEIYKDINNTKIINNGYGFDAYSRIFRQFDLNELYQLRTNIKETLTNLKKYFNYILIINKKKFYNDNDNMEDIKSDIRNEIKTIIDGLHLNKNNKYLNTYYLNTLIPNQTNHSNIIFDEDFEVDKLIINYSLNDNTMNDKYNEYNISPITYNTSDIKDI